MHKVVRFLQIPVIRPAGLDDDDRVWHACAVKKRRSAPTAKRKTPARPARTANRKKTRPDSRRLQLYFGFKVSVEPGSKAAANHGPVQGACAHAAALRDAQNGAV